jgi:protein-disulfide isomerase
VNNIEDQNPTRETKVSYTQFLLPGAILLAALIISGTLIFTRSQNQGTLKTAQIGTLPQEQNKKNKIADIKVNSGDHILGNKNAKVAIVEYSDFECPFCRRFWEETLPQIRKDFIETGKAFLVYRHFPLAFHPSAKPAAYAVECANEQGKFWQMHDKIFEEQKTTPQFSANDLKKWAAAIGLDTAKFNQCLDSEKYAKRVSDDLNSGQAAGVSGTPTFFINGQKVVGAQPYENFKQVIDNLLK